MRYVCIILLAVFGVFTVLYIVEHTTRPDLPPVVRNSFHKPIENKLLSVSELQTDFKLFRSLILDVHPDPYRFTAEKELRAALDSVSRKLNRPIRVVDYYRLLYPVLDKTGCSHTGLELPGTLLDSLKQESIFYPGFFYAAGDSVINPSFRCTSRDSAKLLIAINGEFLPPLMKEFRSFLNAEGNQEVAENKALIYRPAFTYYFVRGAYTNSFQNIYWDAVNHKPSPVYCTPQNFSSSAGIFSRLDQFDYDYYRIDSVKTAVIRLRSFDFSAGHIQRHMLRFFENTFELIKLHGTQNLVLDLRGNGGGQNFLRDTLLSYLFDSSFPDCSRAYSKINRFPFRQYADNFKCNPEVINNKLRTLYAYVNGHYEIRRDSVSIIKPKKNVFRGKIYILTDAVTGSAAAETAAFLQVCGRAVIIGEQCNGYYDGNSSYYLADYTLPSSMLTMRVPLVRNSMLPPGYKGKTGVISPDYPIPMTCNVFTGEDDLPLEKALELIQSGNK